MDAYPLTVVRTLTTIATKLKSNVDLCYRNINKTVAAKLENVNVDLFYSSKNTNSSSKKKKKRNNNNNNNRLII